MSDLLDIGSSGLRAYRHALNAVGENVANAESVGYSRRSVRLVQTQVSGGADLIYRQPIVFNGVTPAGVVRAWDSFRATEARYAASSDGRAAVRSQWLTSIEAALNDGAAGVGQSIGRFFDTATSLSPTPDEPLGRAAMLLALEDVAGAFRNTAGALQRVGEGIRSSAAIDVDAVNRALESIHEINGTIRAATNGSARASLEDDRDKLIDQIAERLDISAEIAGDGTATLRLAGAPSAVLLSGPGTGYLTMAVAADGRLSVQLTFNGTTVPLPISDGRLAGLADMASQNADRRAALDVLAADFTAGVNAWSAGGIDGNGNPGADLLGAPAGAASIQVLTGDPADIPARNAAAANGNLLALPALRESAGFEASWGVIVSGNAQALASARSEAAAASSWKDNAFAALDEVTGVDLDREAADLLRYQQAYNAASRVIQVARDTVNAIFELF